MEKSLFPLILDFVVNLVPKGNMSPPVGHLKKNMFFLFRTDIIIRFVFFVFVPLVLSVSKKVLWFPVINGGTVVTPVIKTKEKKLFRAMPKTFKQALYNISNLQTWFQKYKLDITV